VRNRFRAAAFLVQPDPLEQRGILQHETSDAIAVITMLHLDVHSAAQLRLQFGMYRLSCSQHQIDRTRAFPGSL
jgi:hypothetical protein